MTTSRDDDILLACFFEKIGHWRRLSAGRQSAFPEFLTTLDIESTYVVIDRSINEDQTTRRSDWAADTGHTEFEIRNDRKGNILNRSQWYLPVDFAAFHIDGGKCSPGRGNAGHVEWR